jgi:mutator protein MutT
MSIPLHVVFVSAVIKKNNKYLLSQRSLKDDQAAGIWFFPGGKVEVENINEIIEVALHREVEEEVGVKIKEEIEYLYSQGFVRSSGDHVVGMYFLVEYDSGEPKPLEDQEKVEWFSIEEMEDISKKQNSKYMEPVIEKLKDRT